MYHRYAKFHELHMQLKKCHPDIATYKFPPKKTLRKRVSTYTCYLFFAKIEHSSKTIVYFTQRTLIQFFSV